MRPPVVKGQSASSNDVGRHDHLSSGEMKTAYSDFVSDTGAETCLHQTPIEAQAPLTK